MTEEQRIEIRKIGPEGAEALLKNNVRNRNVRPDHVRKLADEMGQGRWLWNGAPIVLSSDGILLDGQHRLLAVIESGVTLEMVIAYDVDLFAQATIDTGRSRKLADALKMEGEKNAASLAAAVNAAYALSRHNDLQNPLHPSITEAIEWLAVNGTIRDSVLVGMTAQRSEIKFPSGLAAALHFLFAREDEEDAREFFDRLADGADLEVGNPIHTLRKACIADLLKRDRGGRMDRRYRCAITIKAWSAWTMGGELRQLKWRPIREGKSIVNFPTWELNR